MSLFSRLRHTRGRRRHDYVIMITVIFLVAVGLVMLASASSNLGKLKFGDSYYFLKHQLLFGLSIGILGFFLASRVYYRYYEKLTFILLLISIALLLLVFTSLGVEAGGAVRWLKLGPLSFQPSEILKLTLVVYLAAWLSRKKERVDSFFTGFLPFSAVIGLIIFILLQQSSTSSAGLLLAVSLIVYFASGAKPAYILGLILIGALVFGLIIYTTPYRWERIQSFLNPEADLRGGGYHINQALITIGSGGFWGVGYGQSAAKIRYLPEPIGDSIFAIIAEELGFAGAVTVVSAFLIMIIRTFIIAAKSQSKFGQLLLVGFGSLIALQAFTNMAAVSGIIPLTGVSLPFISYGGTALAVFLIIAGIINNVSRYNA